MPVPITLLTDFGWQDVYVAAMKGCIYSIFPEALVVDLTHEIPPQDLVAARFQLMNAAPYFPPKTVHVAVVDPGVGSQRRGVAIACECGVLVGPDNGIFSGVLDRYVAVAAVQLTNPDYWRTPNPSATFHGRDIFAPVGAHLAAGVAIERLGEAISLESLVQLPQLQHQGGDKTMSDWHECDSEPDRSADGQEQLLGVLQAIDRFGNVISTIPTGAWAGEDWCVAIGGAKVPLKQTYSDVPLGTLVALAGSHGWLEVAVNGGSAAERLQLTVGDAVALRRLQSGVQS